MIYSYLIDLKKARPLFDAGHPLHKANSLYFLRKGRSSHLGKATDYYVEPLRKKDFVNSPACFVGRKVGG